MSTDNKVMDFAESKKETEQSSYEQALTQVRLELDQAKKDRNRSNEALEQLQHDYKQLEEQLDQAHKDAKATKRSQETYFNRCQQLQREKEDMQRYKDSYYQMQKSYDALEERYNVAQAALSKLQRAEDIQVQYSKNRLLVDLLNAERGATDAGTA